MAFHTGFIGCAGTGWNGVGLPKVNARVWCPLAPKLHPLLPAQPRRIPRHLSGSLDLSTDVRIAQNMAARLNCWSPARSELHPSIGDLRHAAAFGQQAGGIACHHGRGLPASGLHRADQIDAVAHQVCGDPKAPMRRRRPPSLLRLNERPSFVEQHLAVRWSADHGIRWASRFRFPPAVEGLGSGSGKSRGAVAV